MINRALLVAVLATVAYIAVSPEPAFACSCAAEASETPCAGLASSSVVFAGEVTSIEPYEEPRIRDYPPVRGRRVSLRVLERLFDVPAGDELTVATGTGGGDCGYAFAVGERYLVYGYRHADGTLSTSRCSRTRRLEVAAVDLAFLRAPIGDRARVTVSGVQWESNYGLGEIRPRPVAGVRIAATNAQTTIEGVTDAAGRTSLSVPAGSYLVSASPPRGLYINGPPRPLVVRDARACPRLDFGLRYDGHVVGRVVTSTGAPVANVPLELDFLPRGNRGVAGGRTNPLGEFDLGRVPPGVFALALPATPRILLSTAPDVSRTFEVAASATARLGDLVLPEGTRLVTLTGRVVDAEDRPIAAQVFVRAETDAESMAPIDPILTDADGRFNVMVVAGGRYGLHARVLGLHPGLPPRASAMADATADALPITLRLTTP